MKFPFEIDLFPYTSEGRKSKKKESAMYSLYAVIEHRGSLESGHYVSYVKHNHKWFLCDDEYIYQTSLEDVLQCQAYLLYYIRKDL
jgi:ubiquitin carboxyl-terminal hydrolase 22/27/51